MVLKSWIPPVVTDRLVRRRTTIVPQPTWAAAAEACGDGYQHQRIVDLVVERTLAFRTQLASGPLNHQTRGVPPLPFPMMAGTEAVQVIDWGGGGGHHYMQASRALTGWRIKWAVVETPAMVTGARAVDLETDSLKFFTTIDDAKAWLGQVDAVFTSGALMFTSATDQEQTLLELAATNPAIMQISRQNLIDTEPGGVGIHRARLSAHGPGVHPHEGPDPTIEYPIEIMNRDRFEAIVPGKITMVERSQKAECWWRGDPCHQHGYLTLL